MSEGTKFLRDEHHDTIIKSFSENGLTKDDNLALHTWLTKILDGDLSVDDDEVVELQDSELGDSEEKSEDSEHSEEYSDKGEGGSQDSGEGQGSQACASGKEDRGQGSKKGKACAKLFEDAGLDSSFYGFDRL